MRQFISTREIPEGTKCYLNQDDLTPAFISFEFMDVMYVWVDI